jgi:DNA-binding PadR family transcriptional regulator
MPMIDLAILGALSDQELHGYQLTKRLADVLRPGAAVSFGSVYPALSRLERRGMVKAVEAARRQPTIPMTGSLAGELAARSQAEVPAKAGRARKVYGITARGEAQLVELLLDPAGVTTSAAFDLRLALFHHLQPEQRLEVVRARAAVLAARRADLRRGTATTDRYQFARQARELAVIDHDLAWLADLARAEAAEPAPNTPEGNHD